MTGLQLESREPGFAITTIDPENFNISADDVDSQPAYNLGRLEGFEMAIVGMGGGFTDTSSPRSKSPNILSDFTLSNDSQQAHHDFGMLDEFLAYESTCLNISEPNSTSDFDCDMNALPSLPTPSEIDAWLHTFEFESVEAFTSGSTSTGGFASMPSDSMQDPKAYQIGMRDASQENSPSSSTATGGNPPSSGPFTCNVQGCSRSYRRIHELRRHERVHLSTRPHACRFSNCRRSGQNGFTRKDHLKQHLRQVHGASL